MHRVMIISAILGVPLLAAEDGSFTFNFGGGISTPLNPTGQYAGTSGNFTVGGGYRVNKHSAIVGEFLWSGLPPNLFVIHPVNAPSGTINLYALTANYRFELNNVRKSRFGLYSSVGGGWYYRYASIDKNYVVPPNTACQPIYTWWGYACDPSGYVYSVTVAYKGTSVGGVNAGVGFTVRFADSPWKFYTESRYHYAFNSTIPTTFIPVTFGIRLN